MGSTVESLKRPGYTYNAHYFTKSYPTGFDPCLDPSLP